MSEQESGRPKRPIQGWSIALGALIGAAFALAAAAALWGEPEHLGRSYRGETLSGVCVIAAIAIWRRHDRDGSIRWRLLGGAVGAPAAFGLFWLFLGPTPGPALHTVPLPGFAIAVLDGEVEHRNDNYAFGVLHSRRGRIVVDVLWTPGPPFPDEELVAGAKQILHERFEWTKVHPVASERTYRAGELPVQSVELLAGGNRYQMSLVQCGARLIIPVTAGNSYGEVDLPALHRRVVASIRCTPDPVEERLVGRPPPVALELPEGWRRDEDTALDAEAFFVGPDGGAINVYILLPGLDAEAIAEAVTYTVASMSAPDITWPTPVVAAASAGGHDSWAGTLDDQGERYEVLAVTAPCLSRTMVVIYVGEPGFAPARAALASARCV